MIGMTVILLSFISTSLLALFLLKRASCRGVIHPYKHEPFLICPPPQFCAADISYNTKFNSTTLKSIFLHMSRDVFSAAVLLVLSQAPGGRRPWLFCAAWSISSGVINTVALTLAWPAPFPASEMAAALTLSGKSTIAKTSVLAFAWSPRLLPDPLHRPASRKPA